MAVTRRRVLKTVPAAAIGLATASWLRSGAAQAAGAAAPMAYDPAGRFDVMVSEVEVRRTAAGRVLKARIYQPNGKGPFPTVLDLHGGAWNNKDRLAEQPMNRALAASGLLVVAVDLTLAGEAPYPACVQDANYAVRWLKVHAAAWNGTAAKLGVYGSSPATTRSRWPARRRSMRASPTSRRARRSATRSRATKTRWRVAASR